MGRKKTTKTSQTQSTRTVTEVISSGNGGIVPSISERMQEIVNGPSFGDGHNHYSGSRSRGSSNFCCSNISSQCCKEVDYVEFLNWLA